MEGLFLNRLHKVVDDDKSTTFWRDYVVSASSLSTSVYTLIGPFGFDFPSPSFSVLPSDPSSVVVRDSGGLESRVRNVVSGTDFPRDLCVSLRERWIVSL